MRRSGVTSVREAIRLGRLLVDLMPDEPEARGLLALMLLHNARRDAREGANGAMIMLDEQNRALWHRHEITEGEGFLERAMRVRRVGPYQLQAAISALHCAAPSFDETDWREIAAVYRRLYELQPSPVVALNRAVAIGLATTPAQGLSALDDLAHAEEIARYQPYHAARADLLRRGGRTSEAVDAYTRAIALSSNDGERAYLRRRLAECEAARV